MGVEKNDSKNLKEADIVTAPVISEADAKKKEANKKKKEKEAAKKAAKKEEESKAAENDV